MDGLKKFLRTLRRVHFWIICPLVVVMGLVGWFLTIGTLKKEKQKNLSEIESKYQTVSSLGNEPVHPNDKIEQGMNKMIVARREEVAAAWQEKWDQQTREGGVLTWPDFDWKEDTKREFMSKVSGLRPIEKEVPFPLPPGQDLRKGLRGLYRDYIKDELPKMAEMIGAAWLPVEGGNRSGLQARIEGMSSTAATGIRPDEAIVAWSGANQQELQEQHFNWEGKGNFGRDGGRGATTGNTEPSLLEILYAQEDLWVLKAVMQVIQRANADATARFNATVKEIEWLRIGSAAINSDGRITRASAVEAEVAGPGRERGGSDRERFARTEGSEGDFRGGDGPRDEMGPGMGAAPVDPGDGRYVDKDYKALEPGKLRAVWASTGAVPPEDAYLVVAKWIPVRMRLKVDQRKLHKLLVECANSELTIEVREVRVNPPNDGRRGGGGGIGIFEGGDERGRTGRQGQTNTESNFSFDFTVEIYGIVYIYNPVDRSIIGYEEDTKGGEAAPADEGDVALYERLRKIGIAFGV